MTWSMASLVFTVITVKTREGEETKLYKNSCALVVIGNMNYTGGTPSGCRSEWEGVAAALKKIDFSFDFRTDHKQSIFQEILEGIVDKEGMLRINRFILVKDG